MIHATSSRLCTWWIMLVYATTALHVHHFYIQFCEAFVVRDLHTTSPIVKRMEHHKEDDPNCASQHHTSSSSLSNVLPLYLSSSSSSSSSSSRAATTSSSLSTLSSIPRNVGTQILQGVGPVTYQQLDQYNIPYHIIVSQWIVNRVQKTNQRQSSIRLDCQDDETYFVDNTISIIYPRNNHQGLGFILTEIASGKQNIDNRANANVGITVISDFVPDGAYLTSTTTETQSNKEQQQQPQLMIGDSITSISIIRRRNINQNKLFEEKEQIYQVNVEALSYDATIEAVQELYQKIPSDHDDDMNEFFQVNVKRIRRKPKVTIKLQYPPSMKQKNDTTVELYAGENLRYGLLRRGIVLNDETVPRFDTKVGGNCGANGLCRTCVVSIPNGIDLCNPPRLSEKQILKDELRSRLSCKAIVGYGMKEGNITVRAYPKQW